MAERPRERRRERAPTTHQEVLGVGDQVRSGKMQGRNHDSGRASLWRAQAPHTGRSGPPRDMPWMWAALALTTKRGEQH
eukprot:scaffold32389_cov67-Phaeocystis_antarctica.AAC.4